MALSELRRQPKRPPSASWNLRRRPLGPLEVAWRSRDPQEKAAKYGVVTAERTVRGFGCRKSEHLAIEIIGAAFISRLVELLSTALQPGDQS